MSDDPRKQSPKPKGKFSPAIIFVALALVIVVLLIIWLVTRNPRGAGAPVLPSPTSQMVSPSPSATAVPTAAAADRAEWTMARLEGIIKENTPIRFVRDSTRLLSGETAKIETIAAALAHYKNLQFRFRGHTADFNLKQFQYQLSVLRASKIRWMLENRAGDDINSVTVQGLGSREPVSRGESEAARAPNRRVEIIVQNAEPK